MIQCNFCGFKFTEKEAKTACQKCGLYKKCELLKCPHCGFELAPAPQWFTKLKAKSGGSDEKT